MTDGWHQDFIDILRDPHNPKWDKVTTPKVIEMDERELEQFEAWASCERFSVIRMSQGSHDTYASLSTEFAWLAWQASRAALAPAQPSEWISVKDRLPASGAWVLAHNGKWTGVATYEVLAEWLNERWRDEHSEFVEMLGPAVTHWIPLPAAPSPTKDET